MISSIAKQQITLQMKDIIRLSTRYQEETTAQILQMIWEQARSTASRTEIRTGQLLLLVGTDPLWQIAGTIYAGLSGRHYVVEETRREWQDYISEAPNGLLLCGPRTAFTHERVNGLLAAFQLSAAECLYAQRYREEQRGTFALLTASSLRVWLRTAQKILAWTPHPHPTITYFLPLEDEKLLSERRDDITFMNRETANVAALRERQQDVLAITSHGTDDMSYIGSEDVICGFAGEIDQIQKVPGQVYPACAHDRHCNRSGARLRADHIQSTFTLLNSCMGLRLTETRYPGEFSLGLNFLTGNTTHLIASNQIKEGDSVEAAFFVQLLRAGIPCGEAVRLTNNALFVTDMNAPCYILVGDVDTKLTSGKLLRKDVAVNQEGQFTLAVPEAAPLLHLRIDGDRWYHAAIQRTLYAEIRSSASQELFTVLLPHQQTGQVDLYLFSFGDIAPSQISLRLGLWDQSVSGRVARALHQYYLASPRKLLSDKLKGLADEVKAASLRLARDWKIAVKRSSATHDIQRRTRILHEKLDQMDQLLMIACRHKIIQQRFSFMDAYGEWRLEQHQLSDTRCYLSGHRLHKRVVRHPLLPHSLFYSYTCARCGDILESTDERVNLFLRGSEVFTVGDTICQEIVIENRSSEPLRGYASVMIRDQQFEPRASPDYLRVELAPGEQIALSFSLDYDAQRIQAHVHFMKALFVSDLSVYLASRPIYLERS